MYCIMMATKNFEMLKLNNERLINKVDEVANKIDYASCTDCKLKRSNAMYYRKKNSNNRGRRISVKLQNYNNNNNNKLVQDGTNVNDGGKVEIDDTARRRLIKSKRLITRSDMIVKKTVPWLYERFKRKVHPTDKIMMIQESDGSFFERFGSMLRQQSTIAAEEEEQEKLRVSEQASVIIKETIRDDEESEETDDSKIPLEHLPKCDTDNESTIDDGGGSTSSSDAEIDEKDKIEYISSALNIDDLYTTILYEILHNVGCDVSCDIGQTALFYYVQDAFKVNNQKHEELLKIAEEREPPEIHLNVEIIEAKDLRPKDSNGLSDPFVTLYLASNTAHRYNTSVKIGTLNPVWEEHFALPINGDCDNDTLCLEVWDFDPAETVGEKFGKLFEAKGIKGIRKLVKEIAITATTGLHKNELIGKATIPLKGIPASGMTMWYSLDKRNKINRQGVVKIRMSFSSEMNSQVASQEHRHLIRILLLHELDVSKVAEHWWNGNFSPQAEALITQHIAQTGLQSNDVTLAKWSVYCKIHKDYPLSYGLFVNLLDKLLKPLQTNLYCDEDVKTFWDATRKLLPSLFSLVRRLRKKCEKNVLKQLKEVLMIFAKLFTLDVPNFIDLFPENEYKWLSNVITADGTFDIKKALNEAIIQGANDWFNYVLETNVNNEESNDGKLRYLIKLIQLVRSDLQKSIEFYDKMFQEIVNIQIAKTVYILFQVRIATLVEPEVVTVCKSLKRLSYDGIPTIEDDPTDPLTIGTTLFELYLVLQRFVTLGQGLCPVDYTMFHIKNFHNWFHGGVAQWLDIAVYKARERIKKALELDGLMPVDTTVQYSSSAVDTLTIFYQIKTFWLELNWPDVEGSYTFIAKIIDDICQCCVYYADKMAVKMEGMGEIQDPYEKKFEVTKEWCLAINNIDYVKQSLMPFTNELGMCDIIKKIGDLRSPLEAERCKSTLNIVIANALDTVTNKIIELMEILVTKMSPAMKRLLIEGAELFQQDCNSIDRLMMYVDNNLGMLHNELCEENFGRILEIVWDNLSQILSELIKTNIEKRRPPSFYANLHQTLNLMVKSFKLPNEEFNCPELKRTEHLLMINGMETWDLIHQVHLEQWKEFNEIKDSQYGQLSVIIKFSGDVLKIKVLNAKNLIAMDSNGSCDSFVRIHLLPEDKFANIVKPKTQTKHKTQFPLFDECFAVQLTEEQRNLKDGLVLFSVKDYDLLGYNNQYIGEMFLHFNEIIDSNDDIDTLPQIHLQLGRPNVENSDSINALESRQGDKQAKEFLKRLKMKIGNNNV